MESYESWQGLHPRMAPVKSITDAYVGTASMVKADLTSCLLPVRVKLPDSGSKFDIVSPFSYMEVGKTVHAGAHNHGRSEMNQEKHLSGSIGSATFIWAIAGSHYMRCFCR